MCAVWDGWNGRDGNPDSLFFPVKEEVDAMLAKMEEEAVADNGSDEEWVM